jgi:hypothetical protein
VHWVNKKGLKLLLGSVPGLQGSMDKLYNTQEQQSRDIEALKATKQVNINEQGEKKVDEKNEVDSNNS